MTYRSIDIGDRPVTRVQPGDAPELRWLPLSQLVIDDDFQRPLGRVNWISIDKIAKAFTWSKFTPVVVAFADGDRFSVIDGQHRCHAAKLSGVDAVPCMIVDLSVAEQAEAFTAINGQVTAITPLNIYRAALVARTPWAIACDQVCKDAGVQLMTSNWSAATKKAGQVYTIGLIRKHVEAGRGAMVTSGLKALWSADSCQDPRIWSNHILAPWLAGLQDSPRAIKRDLGGFIKVTDPLLIERRIDHLRTKDANRAISKAVLFQRSWKALLGEWLSKGAAA